VDPRVASADPRPLGGDPRPRFSEPLSAHSRWERRYERAFAWIPYITLLIGCVLSQFRPQRWSERAVTLGIVAVAGVWTWAITAGAGPSFRTRQAAMRIYFIGFLGLATLLIIRDPLFFVYAITGFFHAYLLRPWWVSFGGVAATSIVVNSLILIDDPTPDAWVVFFIVVTIQTLAIGFGLLGGERMHDLSEQRRVAVAELEAALEENAGLHAQLVTQAREAGVLDERQRMAREIHDTIAQGLTGVITQLEAALSSRDRPMDLERHLDAANRLARESLTEARRSVEAVQPLPLENSRLPEALSDVAERWSDVNGMAVQVTTTGIVRPLRPEVEVALLRSAQEGLSNVAKHAGASHTGITLSFMDDVVTLDVRDDGGGFEPGHNGGGRRAGYGLIGMRQRVEQLEGTVTIESHPGEGTAVSVTIPTSAAGTDDVEG
jgi:signal transduction histidine kinase